MKKLFFALLLFSTIAFSQTVKVSTLSGTTAPSVYMANNYYNNGVGSLSTFIWPTGVTCASNGTIYAFDGYVNVIRRIDPDGYTSKFAGVDTFSSPSFAYGYKDGPATMALFSAITAITVDKLNNIYVMDNNRLRKITPDGNVSTVAGDGTAMTFKNAAGLCVDASGTIYVANTGYKNILKVTSTGTVSTFATGFTCPKGITFDASGNLYVGDGATIKKVTSTGATSTYATGLNSASGVCIDTSGNLFVADSFSSIIYKVNTSGVVSNYAGNGIGTFRDGPAGLVKASASFYNPEGLTIDTAGNLYVADRSSQRIRKVTP